MPRWKLTIEYDGSAFLGWQRQRRGRTVQGELEAALSRFCQSTISVMGQGRTDRGVHAEGQVAHADLPADVDANRLLAAMRGLLPADMAVIYAEQKDNSFHARFDAVSRSYRYQIATRPAPLNRQICWVMLKQFDPQLLHDCAELITGEHDFTNFTKESEEPKTSNHCLITVSEWVKREYIWCYRIEGNRFLRYMVRRLVGTMQQVATGALNVEDFEELLTGGEANPKGHAAPPEGLTLVEVIY